VANTEISYCGDAGVKF